MGTGGSGRVGDAVAALAVVTVLAALTAVGVERALEVDRQREARQAQVVAAEVATQVAIGLGEGLRQVQAAAARAAAAPSSASAAVAGTPADAVPGATEVGLVFVGAAPAGAAPAPLSAAEREQAVVAALLDRSRDSGEAHLSGPVELAAGPLRVLAGAVYPGPGVPSSTTERRQRHLAWVVATVDVEDLAQGAAPEGVTVAVPDGPARPGSGEDGARASIEVDDQAIAVAVDVAGGGGSATPWVLGILGAVAAAAAAALVVVARARHRALQEVADAREAQVRLIGDVAPLVQQSLELAEVLPSVAVQLSDHFGLAGVGLSTGSSRAGQVELFSLGTAPDPATKPVLAPPGHLAGGETLRLALQRGGRSVALLHVVAGRPLERAELESLQALSELVTAALVNASLYASQQTAMARLRDLDALKTVFLSTASHELRTPATAIAGFAGLLTSSWDRFTEEQRQDFVERIGSNAQSLSTVVQDLLDFSLLDRGSPELALVRVDLSAVVDAVLDRLGPSFSEHEIEREIEPAVAVHGDRNGLERITTNLLANAVKFSPGASTIRVAVRAEAGEAVLEVSDQGPGVPVDERDRVFARFYRGAGDAVLQTRGVGIGLSVVAELVERMHGVVSIDDAPGGGARFTVALPAASAALAEEVADATTS